MILALLEEQPRHGYELIKELEERTGGAYRPSAGVIYPTLALLEDEGLVRPAGGETGRKLYETTDQGDHISGHTGEDRPRDERERDEPHAAGLRPVSAEGSQSGGSQQ